MGEPDLSCERELDCWWQSCAVIPCSQTGVMLTDTIPIKLRGSSLYDDLQTCKANDRQT